MICQFNCENEAVGEVTARPLSTDQTYYACQHHLEEIRKAGKFKVSLGEGSSLELIVSEMHLWTKT
jgi:hypothetical protein